MTETPFQLDAFLPYLLNRAAEATSREFQTYYKARYGMLRTEWRVVFHLGRFGPMTASEICTRADLHKTKVSRAVAALDRRRFVRRRRMNRDRRHEVLELTHAGRAAFDDLVGEAARYNAALLEPLSEAESEVLTQVLARLAKPG